MRNVPKLSTECQDMQCKNKLYNTFGQVEESMMYKACILKSSVYSLHAVLAGNSVFCFQPISLL